MCDFFSLPVVCNTGPVIGLSRAKLCHVIGEVFPAVIFPEAVVAELRAKDVGDSEQIEKAISRAQVVGLSYSPDALLLAELDQGEASVIQMARDQAIGQVLIDERKARRVASTIYGLEVKGTCALLIEAKRRGLIDRVGPALRAMRSGGYFIGPQLVTECLSRAGEVA